MSFASFGENYAMFDVTPVDNLFLQEYMLRAPGNHVKVYLYGLMQCYHPQENMSLARMAKDLSLEEDEVFAVFQYWERMGLLRRVGDNPPRYVYHSMKQLQLMSGAEAQNLYRYKDFNETLNHLFEGKRRLYDQDLRRVYEWVELYKLPEEVALMLIRHCIDLYGVRFSFEKADALAREWSRQGVCSIEDAEEQTRTGKQQLLDIRRVLRRLGQRREPSQDEQDLFDKWTREWGFPLTAVLDACRETTKGTPTMAYLNAILERQHSLGLHDPAQIQARLVQESAQAAPVRAVLAALGRRGGAPTPADIAWMAQYQALGFAPDAIELAAQVAHHNGGKSLEDVSARLTAWREKGLFTRTAIEGYLNQVKRQNAALQRIFEAFGEARRPTAADRALLTKWREQYQMPEEVLLLAAEASVSAAQKLPFMDAILKRWHQAGITTPEAARQERAAHKSQPAPGKEAAQRPVKEVSAHRYTQRDYSKEELDALYFDPFGDESAQGGDEA